MPKEMLIVYEPALFLLAALGWAAWEFWSMRDRKPKAPPADPPSAREP